MKLSDFEDASRFELVITDTIPITAVDNRTYDKAKRYRDLRTNEVYQVLASGKHYRKSPNIYPTDESTWEFGQAE